MRRTTAFWATVAMVASILLPLRGALAGAPSEAEPPGGSVGRLIAGLGEGRLRDLVLEVLERNPELAAAEAEVRGARERAAQKGYLPDPSAVVTAFASTPETRVGPQRLMVTLGQRLPWFSRLRLERQRAVLAAAAAQARVESRRLVLATEVRRLALELAFVDEQQSILEERRHHLTQHEEIARARYSTGAGMGQDVVKLQAEITRVESALLSLVSERRRWERELATLADRPLDADRSWLDLPPGEPLAMDLEGLLAAAEQGRPELAASSIELARAGLGIALAKQEQRPELSVGLTYTLVDPRNDAAGQLNPTRRDGEDILGLQAGVTIPMWRERRKAAVREAVELEAAAEERQRAQRSAIHREIEGLEAQVPYVWQRLALFDTVLMLQAQESLRSAEAAYRTGRLGALNLLDAEHVLFDTKTALARARADYAILLARLEGAVGAPLDRAVREVGSESPALQGAEP